jgi:hypothetical protein
VSFLTGRSPVIKRLHRAATVVVLLALAGAAVAAPSFPPIGISGRHHPGKFIWFDLVTDDLAASRNFYGAVFGWRFRAVDGSPASYTVVEHAGRNIAGGKPAAGETIAPAGWR